MSKTATAQVGANIRAEMARKGVSQTALAEHLNLGQSGLSKRLRGVIAFDINELTTIAQRLDVPIDVLLTGVGSAA